MADYINTDYIFQEANARRRRALQNAGYQADLTNLLTRGSNSMLDIGRRYARGMEGQVTGFTNRGLGRSGLFQNAMSTYAQNQQGEINDLTARTQADRNLLVRGETDAGTQLQDELDRIARAKQTDILNSAMQLKKWQPYTGLYA